MTTQDPFSAMGGGVQVAGGGWVPKDHPLAQQQQTQQRVLTPHSGPGPIQGPNAPPTQTSSQALTQNATVGAQPQQGGQTNVAGAYQQALVNRLAPPAVNAQNPQIAPAIDANRLAEQRGFERNRNLLAERASAQNFGGSGAFDTQLLGLAQDRAGREAAFEGNAVRDLGRQQEQSVLAALALGGGQLLDQDRLGLQRYGIDTDAALRREGLGASTALGNRDLDLRGELGRGNLNLGLLGLLQGGQQFEQNLSANLGMFGAAQDNAFWRSLL